MLSDHGGSEDPSSASAHPMSALERRSRWLLRAYPAAYRRDRGEEIIGTLLEAKAEGQAWPRVRDVRALAVGGLRARAEQNRRLSTAANLRIAVMAGISFYIVLIGADYLGTWVVDPGPLRDEWHIMLLGLLILAPALITWIAPRVIASLSGVASAVATYFVGPNQLPSWGWISLVVCIAAIVLLAPRSARPPRTWLLLTGAFAAAVVATAAASAGFVVQVMPVLAFLVLSVAWLAIDARLFVAFATFVLTFFLARGRAPFLILTELPYMVAIAGIAALPVWLLKRQSAPRRGTR
jgi:hypothetical protein